MRTIGMVFVLSLLFALPAYAQVELPTISQSASVTQTIARENVPQEFTDILEASLRSMQADAAK
ncbi:MAG: hypothetical protein ABR517_09190 [Thermoanaerobaculia bacterium]